MSKLCPFKQPPHAACVEESCPLWDKDASSGSGMCAELTKAAYTRVLGLATLDIASRLAAIGSWLSIVSAQLNSLTLEKK